VAALTVGAVVAVVAHLLVADRFSIWFIPGAMLASVFSYAAFLRRDRWAERNTCLALAALFFVAPFVGSSVAFAVGAFLIMAAYYIVLAKTSDG
jgi:hypothetical protein